MQRLVVATILFLLSAPALTAEFLRTASAQ